LVAERHAYLTHLANAGLSKSTLQTAADYILVAADRLGLAGRPGESISREEIQRCATRWANRSPRTARRKSGRPSQFESRAIRWLDFLGRLKQPSSSPNPYDEQIAAFADYMHSDRGFSPQTIRKRCRFVQRFLDRFCATDCLRAITVTEIDHALIELVCAGRCARVTVQNYASNLRAFFRYAEMRGWCRSGMASAIQGPRVFAQESLPSGASWGDVQQLLAASQGDRPTDIRDHAILMLLTIYGLRNGEVRTLRLEDFDWERELFFVAGTKTRRARRYPLSRPVGEAILRYLKEVRPRSLHRNLFLTVYPPFRPMTDVTRILSAIEEGDPQAADQLLPLVYEELRKLAAQKMAQEKPGQTLQATALVHEAYVRLVSSPTEQPWNSRGHFLAAAAEAMRRILVEKARQKNRLKRGGGMERVDLDSGCAVGESSRLDLLALDEALAKLAVQEPVKAKLVTLRYFAGLTMPEAATVLGVSLATAERYWTFAKSWLFAELSPPSAEPPPKNRQSP
jgi:RNA polymerase sigma factor (TIGR02999 family)